MKLRNLSSYGPPTAIQGIALALLVLAWSLPATARDLPRQEQKEIRRQVESGTYYTRMAVPCATGRHPYGTYQRPLVEVSPEGANMEDNQMYSSSWWHSDSTYWGIPINAPVEIDEVDFDDEEVEIEFEGVGPAEDESSVLKLVDIYSTADFWAAFNKAFAEKPLQEEHPDWPAEVRQAVGDRQLVNGMTKRQVFYIMGWPERYEVRQEGDTEVEIWWPRQAKGTKVSFFYVKTGEETHLPESIRFEDGLLVNAANAGSGRGVSLD